MQEHFSVCLFQCLPRDILLYWTAWFWFEKQSPHYLQNVQGQKTIGNFPGKESKKNYETIRNETSVFEQKSIEVDDFNEIEEKKVKKRVEKLKQKRREAAEKNKLLNKERKQEISKEEEKKMWERLGELNKNFQDIKKSIKESKKMSKIIFKI